MYPLVPPSKILGGIYPRLPRDLRPWYEKKLIYWRADDLKLKLKSKQSKQRQSKAKAEHAK